MRAPVLHYFVVDKPEVLSVDSSKYIYGQNVIVEIDRKPLETIFKKPLNKCPLRLQRLRVRLQDYDIDIR